MHLHLGIADDIVRHVCPAADLINYGAPVPVDLRLACDGGRFARLVRLAPRALVVLALLLVLALLARFVGLLLLAFFALGLLEFLAFFLLALELLRDRG